MATIAQRPTAPTLPHNVPQRVCRGVGWAMMVIGILGFAAPGLMGMHLGFIHNLMLIGSGILALWYGQNTSADRAANFSMAFGAVSVLVGISGFAFGTYGMPTLTNMIDPVEDRFLLELIPGWLEFGTNDHIVHLALGSAFLLSAVLWKGREKAGVGRSIRRHLDGY